MWLVGGRVGAEHALAEWPASGVSIRIWPQDLAGCALSDLREKTLWWALEMQRDGWRSALGSSFRLAASAGFLQVVVVGDASQHEAQCEAIDTLSVELGFSLHYVSVAEAVSQYEAIASVASEVAALPMVARVAPASGRVFDAELLQGEWLLQQPLRLIHCGQCVQLQEVHALGSRHFRLTLAADTVVAGADILVGAQQPLETSDQFEASLYWLAEQSGLVGRRYRIRLAGQDAPVSMTAVKFRVQPETGAHEACKELRANDLCVATLATQGVMAFDLADNAELRAFEILDMQSEERLALGWIKHSLRRSQNIHRQALSISRQDRERLNGHAGKVIWFTGLSGSGKSTLANALEVALHERQMRTYILDGDNVRYGLNKDLGFTDADRVENIRRIAEVAKLMMDAGLVVMTAFISPFRRERDMARALVGDADFVEIFVSTSLAVCERRDVKGLYKKARAGEIPNMTGVNSPYEPPEHPQLVIDTGTQALDEAVRSIMSWLYDTSPPLDS